MDRLNEQTPLAKLIQSLQKNGFDHPQNIDVLATPVLPDSLDNSSILHNTLLNSANADQLDTFSDNIDLYNNLLNAANSDNISENIEITSTSASGHSGKVQNNSRETKSNLIAENQRMQQKLDELASKKGNKSNDDVRSASSRVASLKTAADMGSDSSVSSTNSIDLKSKAGTKPKAVATFYSGADDVRIRSNSFGVLNRPQSIPFGKTPETNNRNSTASTIKSMAKKLGLGIPKNKLEDSNNQSKFTVKSSPIQSIVSTDKRSSDQYSNMDSSEFSYIATELPYSKSNAPSSLDSDSQYSVNSPKSKYHDDNQTNLSLKGNLIHEMNSSNYTSLPINNASESIAREQLSSNNTEATSSVKSLVRNINLMAMSADVSYVQRPTDVILVPNASVRKKTLPSKTPDIQQYDPMVTKSLEKDVDDLVGPKFDEATYLKNIGFDDMLNQMGIKGSSQEHINNIPGMSPKKLTSVSSNSEGTTTSIVSTILKSLEKSPTDDISPPQKDRGVIATRSRSSSDAKNSPKLGVPSIQQDHAVSSPRPRSASDAKHSPKVDVSAAKQGHVNSPRTRSVSDAKNRNTATLDSKNENTVGEVQKSVREMHKELDQIFAVLNSPASSIKGRPRSTSFKNTEIPSIVSQVTEIIKSESPIVSAKSRGSEKKILEEFQIPKSQSFAVNEMVINERHNEPPNNTSVSSSTDNQRKNQASEVTTALLNSIPDQDRNSKPAAVATPPAVTELMKSLSNDTNMTDSNANSSLKKLPVQNSMSTSRESTETSPVVRVPKGNIVTPKQLSNNISPMTTSVESTPVIESSALKMSIKPATTNGVKSFVALVENRRRRLELEELKRGPTSISESERENIGASKTSKVVGENLTRSRSVSVGSNSSKNSQNEKIQQEIIKDKVDTFEKQARISNLPTYKWVPKTVTRRATIGSQDSTEDKRNKSAVFVNSESGNENRPSSPSLNNSEINRSIVNASHQNKKEERTVKPDNAGTFQPTVSIKDIISRRERMDSISNKVPISTESSQTNILMGGNSDVSSILDSEPIVSHKSNVALIKESFQERSRPSSHISTSSIVSKVADFEKRLSQLNLRNSSKGEETQASDKKLSVKSSQTVLDILSRGSKTEATGSRNSSTYDKSESQNQNDTKSSTSSTLMRSRSNSTDQNRPYSWNKPTAATNNHSLNDTNSTPKTKNDINSNAPAVALNRSNSTGQRSNWNKSTNDINNSRKLDRKSSFKSNTGASKSARVSFGNIHIESTGASIPIGIEKTSKSIEVIGLKDSSKDDKPKIVPKPDNIGGLVRKLTQKSSGSLVINSDSNAATKEFTKIGSTKSESIAAILDSASSNNNAPNYLAYKLEDKSGNNWKPKRQLSVKEKINAFNNAGNSSAVAAEEYKKLVGAKSKTLLK